MLENAVCQNFVGKGTGKYLRINLGDFDHIQLYKEKGCPSPAPEDEGFKPFPSDCYDAGQFGTDYEAFTAIMTKGTPIRDLEAREYPETSDSALVPIRRSMDVSTALLNDIKKSKAAVAVCTDENSVTLNKDPSIVSTFPRIKAPRSQTASIRKISWGMLTL